MREEAAARDILARAGEMPLEPEPPAPAAPLGPPKPDHSVLRDPRDWLLLHVKLHPRKVPACVGCGVWCRGVAGGEGDGCWGLGAGGWGLRLRPHE